jgi:hypothetical protein
MINFIIGGFMKLFYVLFLLPLSACVSSAVKQEFDSRNYSEKDKADMRVYAEKYNKMLSVGSTNMMMADTGGDRTLQATTIQKIYCACYKKLADKCSKNSEGVSSEDRELWAKGNAAEVTLKSLGFAEMADKDLCQ